MKKSLIYLGISIFVFIFGHIYEYFSHGVYSSYMMFAFLIPFIGLFIPSLLNNLILKRKITDNVTLPWKCGIATLTVGSIYKGVLEIYGTSGTFEQVYLIIGSLLCIIATIVLITARVNTDKNCEISD
ncbi:hypothetical protein HMPREF1140_2175 [Lachnoanaerobaculum sp. ICM7]|jgi:hypothetical protein|uniref:hypothetical protein n=1 Tax=Lachnoanaerobaculum sp. ICM7 TaxID=936594 RepID=UPI00027A41BB|nr:hypothetical protein [Lachnoanaerobaculum sp. ICM7]EJP24194.1 hypothetical protein HMPREF1140_2175 [Lachnoanaerobaculum sp. ICM7]